MKVTMRPAVLILAACNVAVAAMPGQAVKNPDDWLWLACGRGKHKCGVGFDVQVQAKESHEVRCCSDVRLPGWKNNGGSCANYHESDLVENGRRQCFHSETYEDAQTICRENGGYVCTKDQVEAGCARGSGCGHDADLIWTSTDAPPRVSISFPSQIRVDPKDYLWLACGRGKGRCGVKTDVSARAGSRHELRCCSPYPVSGWLKSPRPQCKTWHESDLLNENGRKECFHDVTYAEGQKICADNGGYVCTKEEIDDACAKGSGCGHDGDLIWTSSPAPPRNTFAMPGQVAVAPDDYMWLACGRGANGCGLNFALQAQAKEKHEVRCCSKYPNDGWLRKQRCNNWHESNLIDPDDDTKVKCFHDATYAEAQRICKANDGYVCTKEELASKCAKGSGCGHDRDFVWTSTKAPARPPPPVLPTVADTDSFFLGCGRGEGGCNGMDIGVGFANEKHEVRCCSSYPISSWRKFGDCENWSESDLRDPGNPSQVKCYHASTYDEAQKICRANNGHVCTKEEVMTSCARGSGCGHDFDLVWTSTPASPEALAAYIARRRQAASIAGVCTGPTARFSGDPHFTTFDGFRYDCQGQGEFVVAMSKGADPLAIHGRFVRVRSSPKPTVTKSLAIKVLKQVPTFQITVPEKKIKGMCPFTFTMGDSEAALSLLPNESVTGYFKRVYNGTVSYFTNGKSAIFTYPETGTRVHVTAGGGGKRCVINTKLCLTPQKHGGAANIVGLLGSPDGNRDNDWMTKNQTFSPLPPICDIAKPTNAERRLCKKEANIDGHEWCMDNWCIGHASNSLWNSTTHGMYNDCQNRQPDSFFDDVHDADSAIVEACEDAEDPEGCIADTTIADEEGQNITEFIEDIVEEDTEASVVDKLGSGDPEGSLSGWEGPVPADDGSIKCVTPPTGFKEADPVNFGSGPAPAPPSSPNRTSSTQGATIVDTSGSRGDPHFKTWKGEHYEYHGQCDMVLTKHPGFAGGLGLEVQIRTKLVRYWSYIHRAAVRIGNDILEIEGSVDPENRDFHFWINLEYQGEATSIGGFPLSMRSNGGTKKFYEIDLSSKFPGQKIVISAFREFVRVDFEGSSAEAFGNTVGMLGNFGTGDLLARDGKTKIDEFKSLGNEWQLLPSDDMLFHDRAEPQFPRRCLLPEDPQGLRRRRLSESTISVAEAEAACRKVSGDEFDIKDCVYDVLATQDLDMVGAF